jgi:hypothetical protein
VSVPSSKAGCGCWFFWFCGPASRVHKEVQFLWEGILITEGAGSVNKGGEDGVFVGWES